MTDNPCFEGIPPGEDCRLEDMSDRERLLRLEEHIVLLSSSIFNIIQADKDMLKCITLLGEKIGIND